jgi:hypothetical protein
VADRPSTALRDALREAAHTITEYASSPRVMADVARYRAIADAPASVAELLPLVDEVHEVRWFDGDGTEWRAVHADSDGGSRIAIEMRCHRGWMIYYPLAADLARPATLEEVPRG